MNCRPYESEQAGSAQGVELPICFSPFLSLPRTTSLPKLAPATAGSQRPKAPRAGKIPRRGGRRAGKGRLRDRRRAQERGRPRSPPPSKEPQSQKGCSKLQRRKGATARLPQERGDCGQARPTAITARFSCTPNSWWSAPDTALPLTPQRPHDEAGGRGDGAKRA